MLEVLVCRIGGLPGGGFTARRAVFFGWCRRRSIPIRRVRWWAAPREVVECGEEAANV